MRTERELAALLGADPSVERVRSGVMPLAAAGHEYIVLVLPEERPGSRVYLAPVATLERLAIPRWGSDGRPLNWAARRLGDR